MFFFFVSLSVQFSSRSSSSSPSPSNPNLNPNYSSQFANNHFPSSHVKSNPSTPFNFANFGVAPKTINPNLISLNPNPISLNPNPISLNPSKVLPPSSYQPTQQQEMSSFPKENNSERKMGGLKEEGGKGESKEVKEEVASKESTLPNASSIVDNQQRQEEGKWLLANWEE